MTPLLEKTYYKNDYKLILRLKDCRGHDIGWPTFDWTAKIYPASNKANALTASCIGGVCRNCANDGGQIRIFVDNDRPSPGPVVVEWEGQIPDPEFPDGFRKVALKFSANLTLTSETEVSLAAAEEVPVPAGVLQALTRVAADVDSGKQRMAEALTAQGIPTDSGEPLSEMADKVLDLRLAVEGQPGITDQTLGGVLPTYDLLNELRNHRRADYPYCCGVLFPRVTPSVELRMADAYLCSDGFFTEEQDVTHELADTDRDMSYVIYYFRERRYTVPTYFSFIESAYALNGSPQWCSAAAIHDIRSYSTDMDGYTQLTLANLSLGTRALLRGVRSIDVIYNRSFGANARCLSLDDLEEITTLSTSAQVYFQLRNSNLTSLLLPKLQRLEVHLLFECPNMRSVVLPMLRNISKYGTVATNCTALTELSLPGLTTISGGTVVSSCAALTELSLPSLTTVSGGTVVSSCTALTELSLPGLTTISGGTVVSSCTALTELSLPGLTTISGGTVVSSCAALTELSLPSLTTVSGGTVAGICAVTELSLPRLTEIANAALHSSWQSLGRVVIRMPNLKRMTVSNNYNGTANGKEAILEFDTPNLEYLSGSFGRNWAEYQLLIIHLGDKQGGIYNFYSDVGGLNAEITVKPGFRSAMTIQNGSWRLTAECMRDIIANLGDNTGHPALPLVFGSTNLAKLTEEDIALATSKNYTLS